MVLLILGVQAYNHIYQKGFDKGFEKGRQLEKDRLAYDLRNNRTLEIPHVIDDFWGEPYTDGNEHYECKLQGIDNWWTIKFYPNETEREDLK